MQEAPGKTIRHHSLKDIARSFSAAGVPVEENFPMDFPSFPGKTARRSCWDVTVICPLADSYISAAARDAGAAAELAASRKEVKYAGLDDRYVCSDYVRELESTKRFHSPAPFIPRQKID